MLALVGQRLLIGLATIWVISVLVFAVSEVLPGDVASAVMGKEATKESLEAVRRELRLDRPATERYVEWLADFARGDLGTSLASRRPIAGTLEPRLLNTLILAAAAAVATIPLGIMLGLIGAALPGSWFDRSSSGATLFLISIPEFLVGAVLVLVFSVVLNLLPSITFRGTFSSIGDLLRSIALPVLTLAFTLLAHISRMTRAAVLEVLRSSYIEMADLKGLSRPRIVLRHALPNTLGPIATVVAIGLGYLISGVVVVETIFNYPGMGRLMVEAVASRDVPMVQATILLFCAAYILFNLVADVLAIISNPRLRPSR